MRIKVISSLCLLAILISCTNNTPPNLQDNRNFQITGAVNNSANGQSQYRFDGTLNRTDGNPVPVPTIPPPPQSQILPSFNVNYFAGFPNGALGNTDAQGNAAQFVNPSNMAKDSLGNIYVVDRNPFSFPQFTDGLIRKIDTTGNVTTLTINSVDGTVSPPGTKFSDAVGITLDASDNIYVSQVDKIVKISPGRDVTTLYTDPLYNTQDKNDPEGIIIDSSKNIFVSDAKHCVIRKLAFPYNTMDIVIGAINQCYPSDGNGLNGRVANPWGMVYDGSNIFVAEKFSQKIRKIDASLNVTTFAGSSNFYNQYSDRSAAIDGPNSVAQLLLIFGLSFDKNKNIIVGDSDRIRSVDINGNTKTPILNFQVLNGLRPSIYFPQGTISDAAGNIYVSDTTNARILKLSPSTTNVDIPKDNKKYNVTTIAGNEKMAAIDAQGINASFSKPQALAVDTNGNIFVSDYGAIRKIDSSYNVTTLVPANTINSIIYYYGTSTSVSNSPYNIFTNPDGSLTLANGDQLINVSSTGTVTQTPAPAGFNYIDFIKDSSGNTFQIDRNSIRKNDLIFAGKTFPAISDGQGTSAGFVFPNKIAADSSGNIYVADTGSSTIRKIDTAGNVTTIAGQTAKEGYADGNGTNAKFRNPSSLAVDSLGYIYVTDTDNNCIRKISPSGDVWTIAGNTSFQFADGLGTNSKFNKPSSIAIDAADNIYVSDTYNHRIRKLTKQ